MNVSVELKIIIHLPVSAIGYMSAVTTYFSALNIHFSGVTMDLRSLSTMNSNWPRDGFIFFTACLSTLKTKSPLYPSRLHGVAKYCNTMK